MVEPSIQPDAEARGSRDPPSESARVNPGPKRPDPVDMRVPQELDVEFPFDMMDFLSGTKTSDSMLKALGRPNA